ncbi:MAG: ExbD/TolR family protein [Gemmatimonadales bacterium]
MAGELNTKSAVKNEPNVVPMIDIMLVLLIIFMIVTPIISAGFQAKMPFAKSLESRPEEDGDIVLGIDNKGKYYLDPGSGKIGPVPDGKLEEYLTNIFDSRTKDKIMYLKAHQGLEYGEIQDAVEIARKAGVRVLATIAEEQMVSPGKGGGR